MHCSSGDSVHNIKCSRNSFSLASMRYILLRHKCSCNFYNMPVFPLSHSILLWCIPACKLSLNSMLLQVIREFIGEVLSPSIKPYAFHLHICLLFNQNSEILKVNKYLTLFLHEVNPYLSCMVINESNILLTTTHGRGFCKTPYI